MPQVSQSVEIKASPKACYDVVTDFENYPEFSKETKSCVIEKKKGNSFQVTFTVELIKKFSYTIDVEGKPGKSMTWKQVKGDLMKKNEGSWVFEDLGKGVTKATYTVDIEFGLLIPGMISKMLIGKSMPSFLNSVKKRVESLS